MNRIITYCAITAAITSGITYMAYGNYYQYTWDEVHEDQVWSIHNAGFDVKPLVECLSWVQTKYDIYNDAVNAYYVYSGIEPLSGDDLNAYATNIFVWEKAQRVVIQYTNEQVEDCFRGYTELMLD